MFSRDSMKKSESSLKAMDAFVDGADSSSLRSKLVDKKKPISFSATAKETKELQDLVSKYNSLAYKKDCKEINRSDLIMAMKSHFENMGDIEFFELINKIIR